MFNFVLLFQSNDWHRCVAKDSGFSLPRSGSRSAGSAKTVGIRCQFKIGMDRYEMSCEDKRQIFRFISYIEAGSVP